MTVSTGGADELDLLLAEQIAYYRARAPEYLDVKFDIVSKEEGDAAEREMEAALAALGPVGAALELACGPGIWTERLLRQAESVTAVDASPEMLALAAARTRDRGVRFVQADIFRWEPDRLYDLVFFGFWLSHVPLERFEAFWATVAAALEPGGHVFFVDDGYRTADELLEGPDSSTILRRTEDGTAFRAVKVPHEPTGLQQRLASVGWEIEVHPLAGPFFWGAGTFTGV